jgi:hypothetical protein
LTQYQDSRGHSATSDEQLCVDNFPSGTLNELTNLAITPAIYSYTDNNDNEEDENDREQDFSTTPSIEQINNIVDNIH